MDNDLLDALLLANNHPAEPLLELMSCEDPCPLMPQLFLLPSKDDVEAPALSDVGAESMGECLFQNAAVTAKWTRSCRLRE
jgi:hypothetical protein